MACGHDFQRHQVTQFLSTESTNDLGQVVSLETDDKLECLHAQLYCVTWCDVPDLHEWSSVYNADYMQNFPSLIRIWAESKRDH